MWQVLTSETVRRACACSGLFNRWCSQVTVTVTCTAASPTAMAAASPQQQSYKRETSAPDASRSCRAARASPVQGSHSKCTSDVLCSAEYLIRCGAEEGQTLLAD